MTLRTRISLALTLWFVAEALTLAFIVQWVGVGGAILLGIATSILGASLLKRVGTSALTELRRSASAGGPSVFQGTMALDGTLSAIGAVLLLLPGFLTDVIGLALATPALRGGLAQWIKRGGFRSVRGQPRTQHGPGTIDLDPGDWRPADDPVRRPISKV